jgi:hypothetical protein
MDHDHVADDPVPVIQIEMRLDGSMPTGTATGPSGSPRDFTGWVGLMSAVDALAGRASGTGEEDEQCNAQLMRRRRCTDEQ